MSHHVEPLRFAILQCCKPQCELVVAVLLASKLLRHVLMSPSHLVQLARDARASMTLGLRVATQRVLRFCDTDKGVTPHLDVELNQHLDVDQLALFCWQNACYEGRASDRALYLPCLKHNP